MKWFIVLYNLIVFMDLSKKYLLIICPGHRRNLRVGHNASVRETAVGGHTSFDTVTLTQGSQYVPISISTNLRDYRYRWMR